MEVNEKKKQRRFKSIGTGLLGVFTGLLIAVSVLVCRLHQFPIINPNGWMTGAGIGSKDADLIIRAVISKIGIFANSQEQAIYLSAFLENSIDFKKLLPIEDWLSLNSQNHYQIEGNVNMPATWWSITLYNNRDLLVANTENRFSFTNFNLVTDQNGDFRIDISSEKPIDSTNWLPAPKTGPFNLKLRIYEPSVKIFENIASYSLPRIKEVDLL